MKELIPVIGVLYSIKRMHSSEIFPIACYHAIWVSIIVYFFN